MGDARDARSVKERVAAVVLVSNSRQALYHVDCRRCSILHRVGYLWLPHDRAEHGPHCYGHTNFGGLLLRSKCEDLLRASRLHSVL